VTVYEKSDRIGGLMRYGIPDFKLEKYQLDRRIEIMQAEGIVFATKAHVGVNIASDELQAILQRHTFMRWVGITA